MIETKREIKGWIAIPRTFSIEQHRPQRADQNVLWTYITVYERQPHGGRASRQRQKALGKIGMAGRGRQQWAPPTAR